MEPILQDWISPYAKELEKSAVEGDFSYEDLLSGDKIVANRTLQVWYPDCHIGDSIRIVFDTGEGSFEKTFELVGFCRFSPGFVRDPVCPSPERPVRAVSRKPLRKTCEISVDPARKDTAYDALEELAGSNPFFETDNYEHYLAQWENVTSVIRVARIHLSHHPGRHWGDEPDQHP